MYSILSYSVKIISTDIAHCYINVGFLCSVHDHSFPTGVFVYHFT